MTSFSTLIFPSPLFMFFFSLVLQHQLLAKFFLLRFQLSLPIHLLPLFFLLQVVDIMCVNVDKVLQRDEKLSELDDRADALQAGASVFESSAAKLKRKYWWKNCKVSFLVP